MNKIKTVAKWTHKAVIYYLVGYAPIFLMIVIYTSLTGKNLSGPEWPENDFQNFLNNLMFIWIQCLAYFFLALAFYRDFRESLMARLAGFRERDEREELATAKAARHTFLLMLAVQVVFLVLSLTTLQLEPNPESKSGRGMILTMGMSLDSGRHLDFSNSTAAEPSKENPGNIVNKRWLLPPNFFWLLALLISLQIAGFRLFSRRAYRGL